MPINLDQLRAIMKESGLPVYRDEAPTNAQYPYIVYEFVNAIKKWASNKVILSMPLYQISVVTDGTEKEYKPLKAVFDKYGVNYDQFQAEPYDENDSTITQFITTVRVVDG
ncbi:hypothetical protein AABM27_03460 [Heyndrickxia faecalis]|uniref:hypothetical protein n=1 Tax=Heyndrickxia TaxID=2837504 RepID=UPI0018A7CD25|nr:hypothetical protein [Heyndrickxia coagulans]MBF8418946.1 hypothetical protein [Heyndrickxia coagulans]